MGVLSFTTAEVDEILTRQHGEMYIYENTTATTIDAVDEYHMVTDFVTGEVSGFTFNAGAGRSSVSAFADYSGTVAGTVQCTTSAAHGLTTGDYVSITGTTNYNGIFEVTVIDTTNFYFTDTWVADDATGAVVGGSYLEKTAGNPEHYKVMFSTTAYSAANAKEFKFELVKNATMLDNTAVQRNFETTDKGVMSSQGLVELTAGDRISLLVEGITDDTNLTVYHSNVSLMKE